MKTNNYIKYNVHIDKIMNIFDYICEKQNIENIQVLNLELNMNIKFSNERHHKIIKT